MNAFELEHVRDITARNRQISRAVDGAMKDIARRYTTVKGKRFSKALNDRLEALHNQILNNGKDGIRNQWMLANKMNNTAIDGYLSSVKVSDALQKSFRAPNLSALNAFLDRADKGINLSDRVWQVSKSIREEMESLIGQGVLEGKSAVRLSQDLKGYVKGRPIPYAGTLIQGRKLTFQAIRVAATEMNMAFRTADYLQNSKLPFVTGVTVNLSGAHPREDICDDMQGSYPKGFEFTGWHPLCICYAEYDTMPKEDFVKYIKTGEIDPARFTRGMPARATRYLKKKGPKILKYKEKPYWMRDNFTDDFKLSDSVLEPLP